MTLPHLRASAPVEDVTACLRDEGCVIVDGRVPEELTNRIADELAPFIESTTLGVDDFAGRLTRRTGSLIARSPAARQLVMDPLALGTARSFLDHATTVQLHLTQVVSIHPGETAQPLHRDQLAWDSFPFPGDYDVQCNTLWALTEYTAEMGATRVVPGSHRRDDAERFTEADTEPAEMGPGSVLFYTGKLYHGGGANLSDRVRRAVNITYAVGWVRQEENQYLSTPTDVAQTLDDDLLRLMGYQTGAFALGYVGDVEDPLVALRRAPARADLS